MNYSALYMEEGGYPVTRMIVADNIDEAFEKGKKLNPIEFVGVIPFSAQRRLVCTNDFAKKGDA